MSLVLFPVSIEDKLQNIEISIDKTRDVLFNTTLLLTNIKDNEIKNNSLLPDPEIEKIETEYLFPKQIIDFYKKNNMNIIFNDLDLKKFNDLIGNEFSNYVPNELHLEANVVLGNFPIFSNAIQQDFAKIVESKKINDSLDTLLHEYEEDGEYRSLNYNNNSIYLNEELDISEKKLMYVTDLNSSQEQVMNDIKNQNGLVVEGPPGTGKSHTICNVIIDFVRQNKTVALVAQKKTALDVVYSKLGKLSKYSLLIENTNNKIDFYKQLNRIYEMNFNKNQVMMN